jgi:hypothetical protein
MYGGTTRKVQTDVCCTCIKSIFHEFFCGRLEVYNDLARGNTMDRVGIDGLYGPLWPRAFSRTGWHDAFGGYGKTQIIYL